MFGLSVAQTRLLAGALAAFFVTAAGIIGGDSSWVVPAQALIAAVAGALGWTKA